MGARASDGSLAGGRGRGLWSCGKVGQESEGGERGLDEQAGTREAAANGDPSGEVILRLVEGKDREWGWWHGTNGGVSGRSEGPTSPRCTGW